MHVQELETNYDAFTGQHVFEKHRQTQSQLEAHLPQSSKLGFHAAGESDSAHSLTDLGHSEAYTPSSAQCERVPA